MTILRQQGDVIPVKFPQWFSEIKEGDVVFRSQVEVEAATGGFRELFDGSGCSGWQKDDQQQCIGIGGGADEAGKVFCIAVFCESDDVGVRILEQLIPGFIIRDAYFAFACFDVFCQQPCLD